MGSVHGLESEQSVREPGADGELINSMAASMETMSRCRRRPHLLKSRVALAAYVVEFSVSVYSPKKKIKNVSKKMSAARLPRVSFVYFGPFVVLPLP
jgi:hypothetical protein